jgi:hypothetical protein
VALSPPSSVGLNGVQITDTPAADEVLTATDATHAAWAAAAGGGIPATLLDAKGDVIAASAADTAARLAVGANGTVLEAASGETTGLKWGDDPIRKSLLDAKGDLIAGSAADTAARLAVGADGAFLRALASESSGLVWQAGVRVVELFDSTLTVDTAAIDTGAGGFSTALDHLLVFLQTRTTQVIIIGSVLLTLNNDATGTYDDQSVRGRDTTASAVDGQANSSITLATAGASCAAGVFGGMLLAIPNYAGTVAEKTVVCLGGFADEAATGGDAGIRVGHWRNTAAITRLTFTGSSGDLLTGSRVTVYGIG